MENFGLPILIHTILAFLGGCVREIDIVGKKGFDKFKFISGAFVSTFCGIVTFFFCMNFELSLWLTAALTSLAGYIGIPLLDFFIVVLKKRAETMVKLDGQIKRENEKE